MLKAARVRRSNFYRYAIAVLAFAARERTYLYEACDESHIPFFTSLLDGFVSIAPAIKSKR
ncbi:hypothetical protein QFZ39_004942 [Paraburkholderia graminis]|jgi:hypothetical protein|uniref:Uncharacterized protein n=1 Tax=Paraburkholderia graminis TaxID=60548 RepID=A0ABD5CG07_9BURK|nr:hypothetical protein [Paraburkholderia graminis]MDR6204192.1 hypothetical protein [Paraburkholderia graminis]